MTKSATPRRDPEALEREARHAVAFFNLGAFPSRLAMILALEGGERHVGDLQKVVDVDETLLQHHLGLLRHGHVVDVRPDGPRRFYSLNDRGRVLVELARGLGAGAMGQGGEKVALS